MYAKVFLVLIIIWNTETPESTGWIKVVFTLDLFGLIKTNSV